jgi:hypothetical protein
MEDPVTAFSLTIADLDVSHYRTLRAIADNPRHHVQPQRLALFRRLQLVTPAEPPREPHEGKRRVKARAHELTELGKRALANWEAKHGPAVAPPTAHRPVGTGYASPRGGVGGSVAKRGGAL